jgi:hypothetical protein
LNNRKIVMKWLEAVKAYHAKKGTQFLIPKKGSAEYNEIKAMMGGTTGAPAPSTVKAAVAVEKSAAKQADLGANAGDAKVIKRRAPRKAKTQVDVQPESVVAAPVATKAKGRTRAKKVKEESGATALEANAVAKTSLGKLNQAVVGTEGYAKEVEKTIKEGRKIKTRTIEVDPSPPDMTVENLKTEDTVGVDGDASFSFNALKQRLGIH